MQPAMKRNKTTKPLNETEVMANGLQILSLFSVAVMIVYIPIARLASAGRMVVALITYNKTTDALNTKKNEPKIIPVINAIRAKRNPITEIPFSFASEFCDWSGFSIFLFFLSMVGVPQSGHMKASSEISLPQCLQNIIFSSVFFILSQVFLYVKNKYKKNCKINMWKVALATT